MTQLTAEQQLTQADLAEAEESAKRIIDSDKQRYDAVMMEIAKEEADALERLRKVRIRRAAVQKAGYYGRS